MPCLIPLSTLSTVLHSTFTHWPPTDLARSCWPCKSLATMSNDVISSAMSYISDSVRYRGFLDALPPEVIPLIFWISFFSLFRSVRSVFSEFSFSCIALLKFNFLLYFWIDYRSKIWIFSALKWFLNYLSYFLFKLFSSSLNLVSKSFFSSWYLENNFENKNIWIQMKCMLIT